MKKSSNSLIRSISYESKLNNNESFNNDKTQNKSRVKNCDLKCINENKECENDNIAIALLESQSKQKTLSENFNSLTKIIDISIKKPELDKYILYQLSNN
jgi:hypothetical protein